MVLVWMAKFSSNDIIIASITLQSDYRCCAISDYLVGNLVRRSLVDEVKGEIWPIKKIQLF